MSVYFLTTKIIDSLVASFLLTPNKNTNYDVVDAKDKYSSASDDKSGEKKFHFTISTYMHM